MAKKRMKGLKLFRFWPEIENSTTGYNTGAQVMFPWAMEISESPDSKDEPIYADDTLYDEAYSELGCRYTVRFAEMTAEIKAALKGYILESDGTLKVSRNPDGPSIGFGYARLMANGEYRMFKHFGAKVLRVTDIPGTTKGSRGAAATRRWNSTAVGESWTINFIIRRRASARIPAGWTIRLAKARLAA